MPTSPTGRPQRPPRQPPCPLPFPCFRAPQSLCPGPALQTAQDPSWLHPPSCLPAALHPLCSLKLCLCFPASPPCLSQPSSSLFPMPPSLPCGSVTTPHNLQSASCTGMRPHTHAPSWTATSPGTEPADLFRQLRTLRLEHHSTLPVLLGPSGSKKWLAISCTQGLCKQRRNYLQSWTFDFVEAQKASGSS